MAHPGSLTSLGYRPDSSKSNFIAKIASNPCTKRFKNQYIKLNSGLDLIIDDFRVRKYLIS